MRYFKQQILVVIISALSCLSANAEITVNELFFDESKPFHLKIIDVIPKEGIIQIGNDDAENTIIEFMDYFCGYCKKVHPELLQIANKRDDTRLIFLQLKWKMGDLLNPGIFYLEPNGHHFLNHKVLAFYL